MPSKKTFSAVNQQERPTKLRVQNTFKSILMIVGGFVIGNYLVFPYIIDPLLVPIIGMRPFLAVATVIVFTAPGFVWAKNNHSF